MTMRNLQVWAAGVATMSVAAVLAAAPAWAQDPPADGGALTPDQARAACAQAIAETKAALAQEPPHIGKLYGAFDLFKRAVGFWEQGKPYQPCACDTDADAHHWFARCSLVLAPAAHPGVAGTYIWPAALGSSQRCVELNKDHPEGWLLYGDVRSSDLNGRNWAQALPGYENDLVLNPARLESHQKRTYAYLQLGQADRAEAAARAGIAHHPTDSRLHELLGDACYTLERFGDAREAYGAAADLDPANGGLIDKWVNADLMAQQQAGTPPMPRAALEWLAAFDQRHPEHWKAAEKRAWIFIEQMWSGVWKQQGAVAAAPHGDAGVAQLDDLVNRFPSEPQGVYWMQLAARVHRAYKRYDALTAAVVEGIRRDPSNPDLIMGELMNAAGTLNLFDEYRNSQQWERCIALADQILAVLSSDDIAANKRRGVLYQVKFECFQPLGRLDDALQAIRDAIAADPTNGVYRNSHGLMLRYLGQREAALTEFRAALEINAGHEWPSTNLATALMELGRWGEFFPHMAAAMGWAHDRVTAAEDALAMAVNDGGSPKQLAAANENLAYQRFHAANLRRLWLEGLEMQREGAARK